MSFNTSKLKAAFAIATTVLGFGGTVATGALWLSKRFSVVENRVTKIENAVKVLNTEQPEQYKQIIELLLAEKSDLDKNNQAIVALQHHVPISSSPDLMHHVIHLNDLDNYFPGVSADQSGIGVGGLSGAPPPPAKTK